MRAGLLSVIRDELNEVVETYGDDRRTEIIGTQQDLTVEDLINEEDLVVTISHQGYGKTQPLDVYQAQRRGGRGKAATAVKDEDFVEHLLVATQPRHAAVLLRPRQGVLAEGVHDSPGQPGRQGSAAGEHVASSKAKSESLRFFPLKTSRKTSSCSWPRKTARSRKRRLNNFSRPRTAGLIALELEDDNQLVGAALTEGTGEVLLLGSSGKAVRFKEEDVRPMGRTARGVRGIKLTAGQRLDCAHHP